MFALLLLNLLGPITLNIEYNVGRWQWTETSQPWHYAAVQISKGRIGGSGTCISSNYVITNRHVVGTGGRCTVTWLRPHKGKVTTRGTVVSSGPGDQSLVKTTAPSWVRPIPVACSRCGDIAYRGTRLEILGYGSSPRRGKDSLRHFQSRVLDYINGDIKYSSKLIGGDSGGSVISADLHWPRLYGMNARTGNSYGIGPSNVTINRMLTKYFGVPRCTGKGECNEQIVRRRRFGRNDCGPSDDDDDTHPDHPGDRTPPDWWGKEPKEPKEPVANKLFAELQKNSRAIEGILNRPIDIGIQQNRDDISSIADLLAGLQQNTREIKVTLNTAIDANNLSAEHDHELILSVQRNKNSIEALTKISQDLVAIQTDTSAKLKDVKINIQQNIDSVAGIAKNIELLISHIGSMEEKTTVVKQRVPKGQMRVRLWIDEKTNRVVKVQSLN